MSESRLIQRAEELIKRRTIMFTDMKRLTDILKSARKRLNKLKKGKLYIEYVAFGGQVLEYLLVRAIHIHSMCIEEVLFNTSRRMKLKSDVRINIEKDTAGSLISKLSTIRDDEELMKDLGDFFFEHRNKIMHRLFEKYDDADKVNTELSEYVKLDPVGKLIDGLLDAMSDAIEDSSYVLNKIKKQLEKEKLERKKSKR